MGRSERKAKRRHRDPADVEPAPPPHDAVETDAAAQPDAPIDTPIETPAPPTDLTARDLSGDLDRLDSDAWQPMPWPPAAGARGNGFRLVVRRSVMNAVHLHGQSNPDVEVCGVLVGNVHRDAAGPFALVDASVRGDFAGNANAQVTFTAQTWEHIQRVMERDHPDKRIVGWYHTHPGFGIFLSDMDLFIHGNFFNLPWQAALVYDPTSGEEGAFLWRDGKTERAEFAIDEDVEKEIPTIPVSAEVTAAALADFSRRSQAMEKRLRTLTVAIPLLLLVALAWPFVLFTAMRDNRPRWSPMRSGDSAAAASQPAPAATQPTTQLVAARPPVETPPTTQSVAEAPPTSAPATAPAIAVATTEPAAPPATTQAAKPPPDGPPELIRPGRNDAGGAKILEKP